MTKFTDLLEWQALSTHYEQIATLSLHDCFLTNPNRFSEFSLTLDDLFFDYSKNRITQETLSLLGQLAKASQLQEKITHLFNGEIVNRSENRPALHTALRAFAQSEIACGQKNILTDIQTTLDKMRLFTEKVRNKTWRGSTGKPIKDIVNIGIGGSHLGPLMATHALSDFANKEFNIHFISNVDSAHLYHVLNKIDPEAALFIISSKSFTTLETITNALTIRAWLKNQLGNADVTNHFVAVTAAPHLAKQFAIPDANVFTLWDWVGGRYSIWSAIGLPVALLIGMDGFLEFLAGAQRADIHFQTQPFSKNIPVLLGLLSIWYINFFGASHHAVVPYSHHLQYLRLYLQQLEMESNGKNISDEGERLDFLTAPVMLGEQGCNGQHAFHQLLHQGQHFIPVDFILVGKETHNLRHHQDILIGSGLSQAEALMRGKTEAEALAELQKEGYSLPEAEVLAKHKVIPGNRPSNILFLKTITPRSLGTLLAIYEHKTFVQGAIWKINSFDQWGVELGKTLLSHILTELTQESVEWHDASTAGLIQYYKNIRNSA